jgi:4-amino-4-deoxy-L-arabinose transferase-like glycosyltransferase
VQGANMDKIKKIYENNKSIVWIIFFGLITRVVVFLLMKPWTPAVIEQKILLFQSDGFFYNQIALDFLRTFSFDSIGIFRTPGYPLFLVLIYSIFGVKPWVVIFFQFLLNIGSISLLYLLGKAIFNKKIAIIASLFYLIEPYSVFYSSSLMSDGLFTFIFLLSMLMLVYGFKNNKLKYFCISAFLLGVATLVRPITQYFPILVILFILFYKKITLSVRIKNISIYIFIFLIVLAPWLYRNYSKTHVLTLSSLSGGNLLFFNAAVTESYKTGVAWDVVREKFSEDSKKRGTDLSDNLSISAQMKNCIIFEKMAKEYLSKNLKYYIVPHIFGCIKVFLHSANRDIPKGVREFFKDNFNPPITTDNFIKQKYLLVVVSIYLYLFFCYALFFYGAVLMVKEKQIFYLIFILGILFYFVNICGVIGHSRYKLPLVPFYTIISAYAVNKLITNYKNNKELKS